MYDPIIRVLTVLEILQTRERVSGSELAERLEISVRSVQRYITRLQDLCIPVESVRGPGGFYRLKPGFRLPPLMFTDEEAFAVTLGLRALDQLGLSAFAPAAQGASAKLERVLPTPLKDSVRALEDVIAVDPGPWVVPTSPEALITVATAIRTRRVLAFTYQAYDGTKSFRELEPYGVAHLDGRWYLAGHCLMRKAMRTFRLDRTSKLFLQERVFTRPDNFDITAHLQESMPFVQSRYQVDVWLELPLSEVRNHFALHRVLLQAESGGTAARCGRDDVNSFAAILLTLGCRIVVRSPDELRKAFTGLSDRARQAAAV
jgi:predicted DNA-binding transcriptional regulator YafY